MYFCMRRPSACMHCPVKCNGAHTHGSLLLGLWGCLFCEGSWMWLGCAQWVDELVSLRLHPGFAVLPASPRLFLKSKSGCRFVICQWHGMVPLRGLPVSDRTIRAWAVRYSAADDHAAAATDMRAGLCEIFSMSGSGSAQRSLQLTQRLEGLRYRSAVAQPGDATCLLQGFCTASYALKVRSNACGITCEIMPALVTSLHCCVICNSCPRCASPLGCSCTQGKWCNKVSVWCVMHHCWQLFDTKC